jgi:hypothetical protein
MADAGWAGPDRNVSHGGAFLFVDNDGKLVIYVQKNKPSDPIQLKNWLPAPEGAFRFTARFYGPKMGIIDGSYKMPKPLNIN